MDVCNDLTSCHTMPKLWSRLNQKQSKGTHFEGHLWQNKGQAKCTRQWHQPTGLANTLRGLSNCSIGQCGGAPMASLRAEMKSNLQYENSKVFERQNGNRRRYVTVYMKTDHFAHFTKIEIITSLDSAECAAYADIFVFFLRLTSKKLRAINCERCRKPNCEQTQVKNFTIFPYTRSAHALT